MKRGFRNDSWPVRPNGAKVPEVKLLRALEKSKTAPRVRTQSRKDKTLASLRFGVSAPHLPSNGSARRPTTRPRRTNGTTLIEVLAGLVILGTLLVSVAIARGRFLRQWADADRKIAATQEADRLIETWLSGPASSVPLSSQGYTDDAARRPWRTSLVPSPGATTLGSVVVRLQIFENTAATAPACQADFLLRDPRVRPSSAARGHP